MKMLKKFISLSLVLMLSLSTFNISVLASENNSVTSSSLINSLNQFEESSEELNISPTTIISENENEKIYQLTMDGNLYEYHEVKEVVEGKNIIQTTTYLVNDFGDKEKVDYYEISDASYQVMCGPPCFYIAVVAIRAGTSYYLRKTATSATLRTIVSQPASRVAPVVSSYTPHTVSVGGRSFTITKADMSHILQRHHQTYYSASQGNPLNQTFFYDNISTSTINNIASQALRQNAGKIDDYILQGKGYINVQTSYNGVTYNVGSQITGARQITNIYPSTTYIAP